MESFWNKTIKDKPCFEQISENLETEVCIIGAGLTGLSIGYYLGKDKDFVILEKDTICSSTSGKNTGKVTSQHGIFYKYLFDSNGPEFAKKYLEANEKAIENIQKIVNDENIECEFKSESAYIFARKESEKGRIADEEKILNKLQKDRANIVSKIQLPLEIVSAIEFKNQYKINPLKYGYGLANSIVKNCGKIFENSKATKVEKVRR